MTFQVFCASAAENNSWIKQFDKKKISTDYLLNIAPCIDFSDFIDSNFTSNNKKQIKPLMYDKRKWRLLYASLIASRLSGKDSLQQLTSISDFSDENFDRKNPVVPIGIIDFFTNFVSDTSNPNKSKIQKVSVSAIAALQSKVYSKNVTFKIKPEYYFSNKKKNIKNVEIDFGDGNGFSAYSIETAHSINKTYASTGEKSIHFRVCRSSDTLHYFSKIEVVHLSLPTPDKTLNIPSTLTNNTKDTTKSSNIRNSARIDVSVSGGSAFVYLGCDNVLDRPFYIVEGFDPANTNDLGFHLQGNQFGGYSLYTLANRGYDVVILDFNNGGASIYDNKDVFKNLVKAINLQKVGNKEGVALGISMGGLVVRHGLVELENENYEHQIGTYITLDSPHQGANVPVGLQRLATNFPVNVALAIADVFGEESASFLVEGQKSTAGKQMLKRYLGGDPASEFTTFMNDIAAKGHPRNCKKIAIINGANNGTPQWNNPQEGDQIMWVNQYLLGLELKAWANKSGTNTVAYARLNPYNESWTANYSDNLMFDYAPGGRLSNDFPLANNFGKQYYCFVPVVSSLDIRSPENQNLYILNNNASNLIANNAIPFDDIYVTNINTTHTNIAFDQFNIDVRDLVDRLLNLEFNNDRISLQNRTFWNTRQFNASNTITAGRNVFQNTEPNNFAQSRQGDLLIESGANVTFTAGTSIRLLPGFRAKSGSNFRAKIAPQPAICSTGLTLPAPIISGASQVYATPCSTGVFVSKYIYTDRLIKCSDLSNDCSSLVLPSPYSLFTGIYTISNVSSYDNPIVTWIVTPNPFTGNGSVAVGGGTLASTIYFPFNINSTIIFPGQYTISCTVRASGSSNIVSSTFVVQLQTSQCTNSPFGLRKENKETFDSSIEETTDIDFVVFPNPSQGRVNIQFNQFIDNELNIEIVNMNGSVTKFQKQVNSNILQLDMENLADGIYQLRISNDKFNQTKKLVLLK